MCLIESNIVAYLPITGRFLCANELVAPRAHARWNFNKQKLEKNEGALGLKKPIPPFFS